MANSQSLVQRMRPGDWVQMCLLLGAGIVAWSSMRSAVTTVVDREQEHYMILRSSLEKLEMKLDIHFRDYILHLQTESD